MTDTLLKPEDTGEIRRRDPGQTTTNLMFVLNPPVLRRPDATTELPIIDGGCRTVVPEDAPDEFTTAPAEPPKLPPPPPPAPKVDDRPLSVGEEVVWDRSSTYVRPPRRPLAYAGRHRPGWHGKLRRFLADATAPLVRAL